MTNTMQAERRGPGRPPREQQHAERRKKRGGIHGSRMGVSMDLLDFNQYAYRWINDTPGGARMYEKTKNDDWDLVSQDGGVVKNDATDGAVSIIVGTNPDGSPLRAYLCRKPKTWYDEDQAAKQAELDEQLNQLRRGLTRDGQSQSDYVPAGNSIREDRR